MTQKQIEKLQEKNNNIWDKIREFTDLKERELIMEYVQNEILLEQECNK